MPKKILFNVREEEGADQYRQFSYGNCIISHAYQLLQSTNRRQFFRSLRKMKSKLISIIQFQDFLSLLIKYVKEKKCIDKVNTLIERKRSDIADRIACTVHLVQLSSPHSQIAFCQFHSLTFSHFVHSMVETKYPEKRKTIIIKYPKNEKKDKNKNKQILC